MSGIEIGLMWRKASSSTIRSDDGCVEVADLPDGGRALRDSKLGDASPILEFTAHEWACFTDGVKAGEFA
jgi:Domain of unknown function (DUF397)